MIKIEHSIFALPYAYIGAFLAADALNPKSLPPLKEMLLLTVAMVAVRSFAMTFNRIADIKYDRANARTIRRPLVTGEITMRQGIVFCIGSALLFILACAAINRLCLILAVPALLVSGGYSFIKRFSPLCHFWLGATLGLAPLAGFISVAPEGPLLAPALFFFGVTFWVGAFDIFYSCQDMEFDRSVRLHSVPAALGLAPSLAIAAFSHAVTAIFFLLAGWSAGLGPAWYAVWAVVAVILAIEHFILSPQDLSKVNMAFFTLNGIISPVMLAGVIAGIFWR